MHAKHHLCRTDFEIEIVKLPRWTFVDIMFGLTFIFLNFLIDTI